MSDLRYDDLMSRFEEECYHRARAEAKAKEMEAKANAAIFEATALRGDVRALKARIESCTLCIERDAALASSEEWHKAVEKGRALLAEVRQTLDNKKSLG